jgi:hypothetical protein
LAVSALIRSRSPAEPFGFVTQERGRHRNVARRHHPPAMAWLGGIGSGLLGALYANPVLAAIGAGALAVAVVALARRRGWDAAAARHPGRAAVLLVAGLAVTLPAGWYLGSPLIVSATIDEPPPIVGPSAVVPSAATTPSAHTTEVPPSAAAATATPPPATAPPPPPPITLAGAFQGSDDFHFGRGTARLIEVAPGSFVVRLEDFAVRNGPDLYVYLSPSADGYTPDAIELGRLKADRGNQNYAVPRGALPDPNRAASVVIWCKQFAHLFATARLEA